MKTESPYKQVYFHVLRRILDGIYPPETKLPRSRSLAEEFSVSVSTVDKAMTVLAQKGYIRRVAKSGTMVCSRTLWPEQNKPANASKLICFIIHPIGSPRFWMESIEGVESALSAQDYHLIVGNNNGTIEKTLSYIDDLADQGVCGFIISALGMQDRALYERENSRIIAKMRDLGLPFCMYDSHLMNTSCNYVSSTNHDSTFEAMDKLLSMGVKNPICISHKFISSVYEREKAFVDFLRNQNYSDAKERIYRVGIDESADSLYENKALRNLVLSRNFDGLFTTSTEIMNACLKILNEKKKSSDLVLVNYGTDVIKNHSPSISIVQRPYEMGYTVGNVLLDFIRTPTTAIYNVRIPCNIFLNEG